MKKSFLSAITAVLCVSGLSLAAFSAAAHEPGSYESPIVEKRVKRFKQSGGDIQAVFKKHLPAGDLAAIEAAAGRMAAWADEMPAAFPKGSRSVGANDDLWDNFSDFESKAAAMAAAARNLQSAAAAGDAKSAAAAAKKLGGTCKACHQEYRIKH